METAVAGGHRKRPEHLAWYETAIAEEVAFAGLQNAFLRSMASGTCIQVKISDWTVLPK